MAKNCNSLALSPVFIEPASIRLRRDWGLRFEVATPFSKPIGDILFWERPSRMSFEKKNWEVFESFQRMAEPFSKTLLFEKSPKAIKVPFALVRFRLDPRCSPSEVAPNNFDFSGPRQMQA
jgi:hypothetical protein